MRVKLDAAMGRSTWRRRTSAFSNALGSFTTFAQQAGAFAQSTWSTVTTAHVKSLQGKIGSAFEGPNAQVYERLRTVDPDVYRFAKAYDVRLQEQVPTGGWSDWFRPKVERAVLPTRAGGTYHAIQHDPSFTEFQRLSLLRGDVRGSEAFQEFLQAHGSAVRREATLTAAPGSREYAEYQQSKRISEMVRAGATQQEVASYQSAQYWNDVLGPGGTAEQLLHIASPYAARNAALNAPGSTQTFGRRVKRDVLPELQIDSSRYPEIAANIRHAQAAGHPTVLTHGGNALANRQAALRGVPNVPGTSRDEYPFASSKEGGPGAWIGHVPASAQAVQGGLITSFLRKYDIRAGDRYRVIVKP